MVRSPRRPSHAIVCAGFATLLSFAAVAAVAETQPLPRLGLSVPAGTPWQASIRSAGAAPVARVEVGWPRIERQGGGQEWSALETTVSAFADAGFEVVLALEGHPSPLVTESMDAWIAFGRGALERFAGRVSIYEIGPQLDAGGPFDADLRALVLKRTALALRARARDLGLEIRIAQGGVDVNALERQRELWSRDVAAYVDILPVRLDANRPAAAQIEKLGELFRARLTHPPAAAPWVRVKGDVPWDGPALAVSALAAGAEVAVIEGRGPGDDLESLVPWVAGLNDLLAGGYRPAPPGRLRLDYGEARAPGSAGVLARFFNGADLSTLVVYRAPEVPGADTSPRLVVDSSVVRNARVLDPSTGESKPVGAAATPDGSGRALRLVPGAAPAAVRFEKRAAAPGLDLPAEEIEVASTRGLTAEEIIARYQEVQRLEDDHLERWTARGRVDFHFRLGEGTQTVDVSVESNYFWSRGRELEWEQTDYFFNGNKVKWKNIPQLPLIQPEKVITLPLDLSLNKTYAYRLVGRDRVGGREAYVLAFEPAARGADLSLYRGRIWIDVETFARLKTSLVQDNMTSPVLSNEEVDLFREQQDADGRTYRMFSRIDGQQVWNVVGRTFVVRRELTFTDYRINPPVEQFESGRQRAYASDNQMLRDTSEGFRYLERKADGTRVVTDRVKTNQFLLGGGAFKDGSLDSVLPLAAVNYFNYDVGGKGIQFNLFFAGVFGNATASKPDLFGGRADLTAELTFSALAFDDKFFTAGVEQEAERLETLGESLRIRLGLPVGEFFKLNLIGGLRYAGYDLSKEADDALAAYNLANDPDLSYVVPQDHLVTSASVEGIYNRKGYSVSLSGTTASRSDWKAWGLNDGTGFGRLVGGTFVAGAADPLEDTYSRWRARVFKEWYLPKFQKLRGELSWLDGASLDRFSRYQFSFFGEDRLNGFSGSGVRFDEGGIARLGYAFNLFELIQVGATVEQARVEDLSAGQGARSFTGLGVNANVIGPWKTVISAGYGRALSSDIPELEGEQEFLFLVLKLF